MTDDEEMRKELSPAGVSSNPDSTSSTRRVVSDCREYLRDGGDHQSRGQQHQHHASANPCLTVPANMAWDPTSRQLWLGVSRAPQRDASFGGE